MAQYELVREIQNLCPNNQMRDVFFCEVETEDPLEYVRGMVQGNIRELSVAEGENGCVTVYANCDGMTQKFVFSPCD